jgi:hypothetical protein
VIAYSGFLIALAMVVSFMWVALASSNNNNKNVPNSSANNRRRGRQRKTQHEQQGDSQQKLFFSLLIGLILIMPSKINLNINGILLQDFSVTVFVQESAPVYWYLSKCLRGLIRAPITRRKSL